MMSDENVMNLMLHNLHFIIAHFSSFTAYAKLDYLDQYLYVANMVISSEICFA